MSAADWPNDGSDIVSNLERLEPLALLLIEDSPADSRLLQEHLRESIQRGEVMLQVVRRLSDAAQALNRMKYSCVLVDLGLPDCQGVSAIEALRHVDPDVAMIVLTGHDSDEMAQQTMQLGVQDYLVKGRYDAGLLLRRIRFAVQHHRQLAQLNAARAESFASVSHDPVSGLPSRPLFEDRATRALAQAERTGAGVGILSIGFDRLPDSDDDSDAACAETDLALRRIGTALGECLRKSDTVAAMARGEFCVLLAPTDASFDAMVVARRFDETLRALEISGVQLKPHIGIAIYPRDGDALGELLEHAEQAMFRAHRAGGGVCQYEGRESLLTAAATQQTDGWCGTPLDCIELLYQPWYDLRSGLPIGVEAQWSRDDLIAWRGTGGESRREAGLAMIKVALDCFRNWRQAGLNVPALALNLDAVLLDQPDLLSWLGRELSQHGLEARDLRLEISATDLANATPELLARLRQLRDEGFGLTLDDFLTSADCLGSVTAASIDAIKLGRQSIALLPIGQTGGSLRRSVIATIGAAMNLSLDLIACGVDDEARREMLGALGIRYLQGDALCPAMTADELRASWRQANAA